ncbi:hypothetical protein KC717_05300 [Candidatus Dojkabacteria bacterium]|uniref:DZANK-type domain-containing protein n=1 Tax=Candidatus Dojkabacteria bacterium TaxID=2099670 RepID=A0A955RKR0_9BACT|nr:hypothetical protein [Candidatus Dojkabacteria bacterium]
MNAFFETLFLLHPNELQLLMDVLFVGVIVGVYLVPLVFVIIDIRKRYTNPRQKMWLILMAILFFPIFLFTYTMFRRQHTVDDDQEYEREHTLSMIEAKATVCPKCDGICRENDNFCGTCGFLLHRICEQCNIITDFSWEYCTNCGYELEQPEIPQLNESTEKRTKLVEALGYKIQHLIIKEK